MSIFKTTIPIYSNTRDLLGSCRFYHRETWNDLVIRLSEFYLENNKEKKNLTKNRDLNEKQKKK